MSINNTLERLGLPVECAPFDGILNNAKRGYFRIERTIERRLVNRTWQRTITSERIVPVVEQVKVGMTSAMALNLMSEIYHGNQFSNFHVGFNSVSFVKPAATFIAPTGPQEGKEYWTMGQVLECSEEFFRMSQDSIYMNTEKDGSPSDGRVSVEVIETTRIANRTIRYRKVEEYRKGQLEAKFGFTTDQLASFVFYQWDLTKPNQETHLVNVATDLEVLAPNVFWPNAYLNGRDDDSFDFQELITHYSQTTPDFIFRVYAHDESTNEDYPDPNYSGMGNFGKCLDLPFENERVKPIRVEFGDVQRTQVDNNDDELVITFKEGTSRALIALSLEYKPLDGKKVEHWIGYDLLQQKKIWSIFDAS